MTNEQLERLPKYARDCIKNLQQKLEWDTVYYKKQLNSAEEGTGPIGWGLGSDISYFLPEAAVVHFDLDGRDVVARVEDGMIYIQSKDQGLAVLPAYSNCVCIGVLDDS